MILYHTSDRKIEYPDIHYGRKNADFGWGFYLTPDREFTYRWARKNAIVNIYEFDPTGLIIQNFSRNEEWFGYIAANRRFEDSLTADAVIGPIANDTIFNTLGVINSGHLNPKEALQLLMIGPEYTQIAVKSEAAMDRLKWMDTERIERPNADILKAEQDAYLEEFSKRISDM